MRPRMVHRMGKRNFLIVGHSGAGKTTVCNELQRRGYHAVHGDDELAYRGDPETGEPTDVIAYEHWIWHVHKVEDLIADREEDATYFCGGARNYFRFLGLFDAVFFLDVDLDTLNRRLDERPDEDWDGGVPTARELLAHLHQTRDNIPETAIPIDATAPVEAVVDQILRLSS
jgi:thymidylate kinase